MNSVDYLNNTVYCRLAPSNLHGIGVIAIRDIPKGTRYTDVTNNNYWESPIFTLTEKEFSELLPEIQSLILDRTIFPEDDISFISPNADCILRSFMNHSDIPNTDGEITLRDIKAGEELTEDYFSFTKTMNPLTRKHFANL